MEPPTRWPAGLAAAAGRRPTRHTVGQGSPRCERETRGGRLPGDQRAEGLYRKALITPILQLLAARDRASACEVQYLRQETPEKEPADIVLELDLRLQMVQQG